MKPWHPSTTAILEAVADEYGVSAERLRARSRKRPLPEARHVAQYLIRLLRELSYDTIAPTFNQHHVNVLRSCRVVARRRLTDPAFDDCIGRLAESLQAGAATLPVACTLRERMRTAETTLRELRLRLDALEALLAIRKTA